MMAMTIAYLPPVEQKIRPRTSSLNAKRKKAKELLNLLRRLEAVKIVENHQKLVQMERKTPSSGMALLKM